jgi:hypothetical protein
MKNKTKSSFLILALMLCSGPLSAMEDQVNESADAASSGEKLEGDRQQTSKQPKRIHYMPFQEEEKTVRPSSLDLSKLLKEQENWQDWKPEAPRKQRLTSYFKEKMARFNLQETRSVNLNSAFFKTLESQGFDQEDFGENFIEAALNELNNVTNIIIDWEKNLSENLDKNGVYHWFFSKLFEKKELSLFIRTREETFSIKKLFPKKEQILNLKALIFPIVGRSIHPLNILDFQDYKDYLHNLKSFGIEFPMKDFEVLKDTLPKTLEDLFLTLEEPSLENEDNLNNLVKKMPNLKRFGVHTLKSSDRLNYKALFESLPPSLRELCVIEKERTLSDESYPYIFSTKNLAVKQTKKASCFSGLVEKLGRFPNLESLYLFNAKGSGPTLFKGLQKTLPEKHPLKQITFDLLEQYESFLCPSRNPLQENALEEKLVICLGNEKSHITRSSIIFCEKTMKSALQEYLDACSLLEDSLKINLETKTCTLDFKGPHNGKKLFLAPALIKALNTCALRLYGKLSYEYYQLNINIPEGISPSWLPNTYMLLRKVKKNFSGAFSPVTPKNVKEFSSRLFSF